MKPVLLDLTKSGIFHDDELSIETRTTFVFGKNGTGKSTLASLMKQKSSEYDVRCFQGFNNIVGDDKKLNAVILGEKNNEVDQKIKIYEEEIRKKEEKIKYWEKETTISVENENNLCSRVRNVKMDIDKRNKKLKVFFSEAAKLIKNENNPQIARPSYNAQNFRDEIPKAKKLTPKEIEINGDILKSEIKIANKINYKTIDIDFTEFLRRVNHLLNKKVEAKEIIEEIKDNSPKERFAESGMHIHKEGEKCAFCGGVLSKERYAKLKRYFSSDDVSLFKKSLESCSAELNKAIDDIHRLSLDVSGFYSEYEDRLLLIIEKFKNKKTDVLSYLNNLKNSIDDKMKELFKESETLRLEIPEALEAEILKYNNLVDENNSSDLERKKESSMEKLRYNKIKECIDEFGYDQELKELKEVELRHQVISEELNEEKQKINVCRTEIREVQEKIRDLVSQTKNENVIANKINSKLKMYANFELVHERSQDRGEGHYVVRSKHTGERRDITKLSTGEKNIIAFLYFEYKLEEVSSTGEKLPKIVIFDDPMTSNDDDAQYLMIEELNRLIKRIEKSQDDIIIIMTHNKHFYLNIKYLYNKDYKKRGFLRLISDKKKTSVKRIKSEGEDFRTSYESLWKELKTMYSLAEGGAVPSSMLLNPIRRIIETYTKFNCVKPVDMLDNVPGAKKLLDVNSHSIDDLEAELNGRNQKDIIEMMQECFNKINSSEHFDRYWNSN